MKQLIALALVYFYSTCTHAQVLIALVFGEKLQTEKLTFGLVVTPTFATITNVGGGYKSGLGLGLYFDIKLSENFFLHPEAVPKSSLGSKDIPPYTTGSDSLDAFFINGSIERKLKAISLPLLCRYRIKGLFFADLGPQIDWILKAKDINTADMGGNEITHTTDIKDQFTRFDFGVAGGLEYKLKKDKGMGLGVRYFYGFTDVMNTEGKQNNRALYFNISIPVGTGKGNGTTTTK